MPMMNARTLGSLVILTGFALALNLVGNGSFHLFDRDEPRFAQAAREMQATGNYIVPSFNGKPRYDKPILIYWLMNASSLALGVGEEALLLKPGEFDRAAFAARLPSALCGALAVLVVALWGLRVLGSRAGMAPGWIMASSLLVLVESKIATADGLLLLCMAVTLRCLFEVVLRTDRRIHHLGFWVFLALATLAKGPVAPGIVGATILCYGLFTREWRVFLGLRLGWGIPLYLALVLPWTIAAAIQTGGEFLQVALGHHVLNRSLTPLEGHRGFFGFHAVLPLVTFLPWGFLLPGILAGAFRQAKEDTTRLFLLSNLIGPLILFELVQTKLAHYMLPSFPAMALLAGLYFRDGDRGVRRLADWGPRVAFGLVVAAFVALVVFLPEALADAELGAHVEAVFRPLAVFFIILGIGYALLVAHRTRAGFALLVVAPALLLPLLLLHLKPVITELQFAPHLARQTRAVSGAAGEPVIFDHYEPSLVFYFNRIPVLETPEQVAAYLKENPHPVVLTEAEEIRQELAEFPLVQQGAVTGYNFAKGETVTWLILTPAGGDLHAGGS